MTSRTITITTWYAKDGMEFTTSTECAEYEKSLMKIKDIHGGDVFKMTGSSVAILIAETFHGEIIFLGNEREADNFFSTYIPYIDGQGDKHIMTKSEAIDYLNKGEWKFIKNIKLSL